MHNTNLLIDEFLSIKNEDNFNDLSIKLFNLHFIHNPVYRQYILNLKPDFMPETINSYAQIPFLPIELFKTHKILLNNYTPIDFFKSSGTTSSNSSKHFIVDFSVYEKSFLKAFKLFWGEPEDYIILALLPNYIEQQHSSLVYMVEELIKQSNSDLSGFYLYNYEELYQKLTLIEKENKKCLLFGVSFALLEFAEKYKIRLKSTKVIETGGMKGRRKEIIREELHSTLSKAFMCDKIYSEYGMCELFSQAYMKEDGSFLSPPWMKVLSRQINNPLELTSNDGIGERGGINVIDLSNIYSCPFIATQDIGVVNGDGSFLIYGRFDSSEIRGCNLLYL